MTYNDMLQPNSILDNLVIAMIPEGAAGNHTVTGITTADRLLKVWSFSMTLSEGTPNTVACAVADLTSEFSITAANTINNTGGTAITDGWGLVFYLNDGA